MIDNNKKTKIYLLKSSLDTGFDTKLENMKLQNQLRYVVFDEYQDEALIYLKELDVETFDRSVYLDVGSTLKNRLDLSIFLPTDLLELNFVVKRKIVTYNKSTTMFDIQMYQLLEIAKDNDYQIMNFPEHLNFQHITWIMKVLIHHDIRFIPLDTSLLVHKMDLEIIFGSDVFKTVPIIIN